MHTDYFIKIMADQHFVLKWHYHETTLIRNLPYLLENDILSDVTISVGADNIKAHKIILAMCSVYFLQLFQDLRNTQHPVVVLHNASVEDVKAMLSFMYKGQCVVSKEQLPNLLSVAKLLKIQGLCDMKVPEIEIRTNPTIPNLVTADTTQKIPESNLSIDSNTKTSTGCERLDDSSPDDDKFDQKYRLEHRIIENEISRYKENELQSKENSSNNLKRQLDCDRDIAINLTIDSKKAQSSCSPSWEKPLEVASPENVSPCSTEDLSLSYPRPQTSIIRKLTSTNKDVSETCKCFLCGKYLSNQYNLRVHMETHEEAYHACQSCPHVSRSRDALRKHVSYRHPEEYLSRKRRKTDSS